MNAVAIIVVLAVVVCLVRGVVCYSRAHPHRVYTRPSGNRLLCRRRRQRAILQARDLARVAIAGHSDPTAPLAAGVSLEPGEEAWGFASARLAVRTSQAVWISHGQVSWFGRRSRNVTQGAVTERWEDRGNIDWLITSHRVVGRMPASKEMISVWWGGLAGIDIDLKRGRIVLNGVNGWTGILVGPSIAPIGVVAVAACYGLEAVLVHPALEQVRRNGSNEPPLRDGPAAVGSGATIIRLATRKRPA